MRTNTEALHFVIDGRAMIRVGAEAMPDAGLDEHENEHESAVTATSGRGVRGLR